MENNVQVFNNDEFGEVRTVMIHGEPWFVASDVCKVLEIGNPSQAFTRLDDDEKQITLISNEGNRGNPNVVVIKRGTNAKGSVLSCVERIGNGYRR